MGPLAMKGILIRVRRMPYPGMALFPFILLRHDVSCRDEVLVRHERIHLRQQLETGIVFFYAWYLLEYLFYLIRFRSHHKAYRSIVFEREAYAGQADENYLCFRKPWAFLFAPVFRD